MVVNIRYYSPLRYPGGKGRLTDFMEIIIKKNNLENGIYIEPYAGGAGMALKLLMNGIVSKIIINDLSKSIYSFWYSILNYNEEFCNKVKDIPVNIEMWKKQREIQSNKDKTSLFELGFSTFYLNRCNRSGILTGGVIGGLKQEGNWKIDARFNKENLLKRIKIIGKFKENILLYNKDASVFIEENLSDMNDNNLVYLDPPYYQKGKKLYENYYDKSDHEHLAEQIKNISQYWVLTYDNVEKIVELYNDCKYIFYSLNYSAKKKYKGSEIMIFCDRLNIPDIENPVKVE
ncbi:MAG: DNA adenine methylase [Candidatus Woesearchaeota archaeon]